MKLTFLFRTLILGSLIFFDAHATSSLSYSGRLVSNNGAPVVGPVKLRFDLAYNTDPTDILCSDEINGLDLINGVFHAKIDFDCGVSSSLENVLLETPEGSTVSIRVTDVTNSSSHRVYSFQALHSIPTSIVSGMANQLAPLNASAAGEVLTWDGGKWKAAAPFSSGGTVSSITAHEGLSGGTITSAGSIGIADGGVTAVKLHSMGANSTGQVLKWNGASWAAGVDQDNGVVESNVRKFALNNDPLTPAPTCTGHQVIRYVLLTDSLECFDLVNDNIDITKSNLAPSQKAVAEALELKQDKIESSLKLTSGTNSVTLGTPASGGDISYTLPLMGISGQVLKLGASGVLEWGDTGVSGSDIAANSITNTHVADGALSQSKISGLTTDLTAIDTRITNLKTDDVTEGTVNKYFTNERVLLAPLAGLTPTTGPINAMDSLLVAFNKIVGNANDLAGAVTTLSTNQSNYLLKDGTSAMSGNLAMGGNLITNVGYPSNDTDAATMKYVNDTLNVATTWLKADPDIYYNAGKVGIGTDSPNSPLQIYAPTVGTKFIKIGNIANPTTTAGAGGMVVDVNGGGGIYMSDSTAGIHGKYEVYNGVLGIGTMSNHPMRFTTNNIDRMYFDIAGNVGVGTITPNSRMTVNGVLALKESAAPALTADYGKLYVGIDSKLYFLNDLGVTTVLGSSDGGTPGDNTISSAKITDGSIVDADINATAGIDATKIGNGDVDNTELSYLNGVTSPIQTQFSNIRQVPAGTDTNNYLRGDNTWQPLTTSVVPEGTNKYFTEALVQSTLMTSYIPLPSAGLAATDSLVQALGKLQGQISSNDSDITALGNKGQWDKNGTSVYYSGGNVGIGTNVPGTKFNVVKTEVGGPTQYGVLSIEDTDAHLDIISTSEGEWGSFINLVQTDNVTKAFSNVWNIGRQSSTAGTNALHFNFGTNNSHNNPTKMLITTDGKLGIGSPLPASKVDIRAGAISGSIMALSEDNNDGFVLGGNLLGNQGENRFYIGRTGYSIDTASWAAPLELLSIKANGNVGVGNSAPSEKLDVVGNVKATAYLYTSDRRLKENIETIENSSEKVLALRGVEFDWKKDGKHEIGFIAQEVEEIEPNLVVTSEVDGIKAVKYGNVVALLVEAFKEHHQKLEENQKLFMTMNQGMNTRVKELEREVASLKDENKKLKEDIELIKKHLKIK